MERVLSSSTTVIHRRIMPVALCICWSVDIAIAVAVVMETHEWAWSLIPIPTGILFWFAYLYFCAPFVDRVVWDDGQGILRVRKGRVDTTIPLRQIASLHSTLGTTPQRVTLELREASPLGKVITFIPQVPKSLSTLTTESKEIQELRAKIA